MQRQVDLDTPVIFLEMGYPQEDEIGNICAKRKRDENTYRYNKDRTGEKNQVLGQLEIENIIDSFSGLDFQDEKPAHHKSQYSENNTGENGDPDGFPEVLFEGKARP
jgi:hypothetical protein